MEGVVIDARESWKATFKAWHAQGKSIDEMKNLILKTCDPSVVPPIILLLEDWTPE
jgi:hypothetical protein